MSDTRTTVEPGSTIHGITPYPSSFSGVVTLGIFPGSIVTLKTGGPSMVVETTTAEKAYCNWHNDAGDLLRDWVGLVCLKVKP